MARELAVWQFVDSNTKTYQYILTKPEGDHVEGAMPLYTEGTYTDQPPFVYKHTVVEPDGHTMTIYSPSQTNPWDGSPGEKTSDPLFF